MSLRLYMDHQVPSAITRGLRQRGIDVLTADDDDTAQSDDEALLRRAAELGRIIFTQDDDFLDIGTEWQRSNIEFVGIVYGHQLRVTIGQAIRNLEVIAQVMSPDEMKNRIEFLPLR